MTICPPLGCHLSTNLSRSCARELGDPASMFACRIDGAALSLCWGSPYSGWGHCCRNWRGIPDSGHSYWCHCVGKQVSQQNPSNANVMVHPAVLCQSSPCTHASDTPAASYCATAILAWMLGNATFDVRRKKVCIPLTLSPCILTYLVSSVASPNWFYLACNKNGLSRNWSLYNSAIWTWSYETHVRKDFGHGGLKASYCWCALGQVLSAHDVFL